MVSKVVLIALVALACSHSAQAFFFLPLSFGSSPFFGRFGNNQYFGGFGGNNAVSNSDAVSFFGPSNANAVAINSGGGFSFGGNNARADSNAISFFGPSNANSAAIIADGGFGFGGNNAVANSRAFGGTGASANSVSSIGGGRKLMQSRFSPYYYNNYFPFNYGGSFNPFWAPFFTGFGGNNARSNSNAVTFLGPADANAVAIATGNNGGFLGSIFGSRNSATANANAVSTLGTANANGVAIATGGKGGIFGGGGNSARSSTNAFGALGANSNSVSIAGP